MKKFADWFTGRDVENGPISVGGQAVMEGVMMKGPKYTAIAVREKSGRIVAKRDKSISVGKKYKFLRWPIIRGVVNFVVMMYGGVKTLMDSAEMAGEEMEEPSKFEKKVASILHVKADDVMMIMAVVLALVLAIGMFFVLPTAAEALIKKFVTSKVAVNLLGGIVRMIIFLVYVLLCSRLKEIRRVFQYHGAEHKTVYCYEAGLPLTVENAQKFSTLHPRCGTSFLVIVMLISILVFTVLGTDTSNVFARVGSRLLLLPLVAGVSYEILKWLGRAKENAIIKALKWPGLMMQKITTAEPDDSMVEVAICSLKYALEMPDALPVYEDEQTAEEQA
ncbi:MAG: DUF1385 domain-containing protein [Clostridia bacterium]|nr:DUF1385 domain-containing protein [Clostridia bacterium]